MKTQVLNRLQEVQHRNCMTYSHVLMKKEGPSSQFWNPAHASMKIRCRQKRVPSLLLKLHNAKNMKTSASTQICTFLKTARNLWKRRSFNIRLWQLERRLYNTVELEEAGLLFSCQVLKTKSKTKISKHYFTKLQAKKNFYQILRNWLIKMIRGKKDTSKNAKLNKFWHEKKATRNPVL